jgi:uncharacterized protein YkwD
LKNIIEFIKRLFFGKKQETQITVLPVHYHITADDHFILPPEYELIKEINRLRILKHDSPALFVSREMCIVGTQHGEYMAQLGHPSHDYFTLRASLFPNGELGEIIAFNFNSIPGVVSAWIKSEAHSKILFDKKYRTIGCGIVTDNNNRKYYTVLFKV